MHSLKKNEMYNIQYTMHKVNVPDRHHPKTPLLDGY